MINGSPSVLINKSLKTYRALIYLLIFLIVSFSFFFSNPHKICADSDKAAYDDEVDITAESAVILDYETGNVLWEKDSDKSMYPASTTKMLSSIVAIENIDNFDEIIEISDNASGKNHSPFRFRTGDSISLMDLLKAALIWSHNNAPIALAEYVSGNVEDFIGLMNKKARKINADNSFFQNTNGLDNESPDHKSTAKDLAVIARYCMENDLFREIVGIRKDTILINGKEVEIENTNELLVYEYIKGIKTGYTDNAGSCIAVYSEKNDFKLITVVLNSSMGKREEDVLDLLDWAYDNLKYIEIVNSDHIATTATIGKQNILNVNLYPEASYTKLINISSSNVEVKNEIKSDINLPIEKRDVMGTMDIFINGKKIKEINLISKESIGNIYVYQELSSADESNTRLIIIILLVFYFLIIIFIMVRNLFTKKKVKF